MALSPSFIIPLLLEQILGRSDGIHMPCPHRLDMSCLIANQSFSSCQVKSAFATACASCVEVGSWAAGSHRATESAPSASCAHVRLYNCPDASSLAVSCPVRRPAPLQSVYRELVVVSPAGTAHCNDPCLGHHDRSFQVALGGAIRNRGRGGRGGHLGGPPACRRSGGAPHLWVAPPLQLRLPPSWQQSTETPAIED